MQILLVFLDSRNNILAFCSECLSLTKKPQVLYIIIYILNLNLNPEPYFDCKCNAISDYISDYICQPMTEFQNIKFNSMQINQFYYFIAQLSLGKNFAYIKHVLDLNIPYYLLVFHINIFN